jgi:hypothetical protein
MQRELVLRLAGLLWRLRRATRIEAGLFDIQATLLKNLKADDAAQRQMMHAIFGQTVLKPESSFPPEAVERQEYELRDVALNNSSADLARCYLRLAHLPSFALDRLNRYEAALWRQVAQTLFALDALDRRKPQERRRCLVI